MFLPVVFNDFSTKSRIGRTAYLVKVMNHFQVVGQETQCHGLGDTDRTVDESHTLFHVKMEAINNHELATEHDLIGDRRQLVSPVLDLHGGMEA